MLTYGFSMLTYETPGQGGGAPYGRNVWNSTETILNMLVDTVSLDLVAWSVHRLAIVCSSFGWVVQDIRS